MESLLVLGMMILSAKYSTGENGPLTRYVKSRVVHAPGMPGTFSSPPNSKDTAK